MPLPEAVAAPAGDKDQDAETESGKSDKNATVTSSLTIDELSGAQFWPVRLREMVVYGLSLTPRGLAYQFGSSEPDNGGMDCSGTLYHVMTHQGVKKVPRSSDDMFHWVEDAGLLNRVSGAPEQDDSALAAMRPGDLLFWTGTYDTGPDPDRISHVMMYLGKTAGGSPVMFGASNGRPYEGKRQNGVSVFDFRMPKAEGKARFVGYGPIPGMDIDSVAPQPPTQGKPADTARASVPAKKPTPSAAKPRGTTSVDDEDTDDTEQSAPPSKTSRRKPATKSTTDGYEAPAKRTSTKRAKTSTSESAGSSSTRKKSNRRS